MAGSKFRISLIIALVSMAASEAFSQQAYYRDSITGYNNEKVILKPRIHYSAGSSLTVIPHLGTVTGFTASPFLSIPLSSKLSVNGGLIAGRYFSVLRDITTEGVLSGAYNELSVYGSAAYHVNPQLTVYGIASKQLAGTTPYSFMRGSSYTVGSTMKFGEFSIGFAMQVSKWDDAFSHFPVGNSQGFYSPFIHRPGIMTPFDR